jgi:hypothetical protein
MSIRHRNQTSPSIHQSKPNTNASLLHIPPHAPPDAHHLKPRNTHDNHKAISASNVLPCTTAHRSHNQPELTMKPSQHPPLPRDHLLNLDDRETLRESQSSKIIEKSMRNSSIRNPKLNPNPKQ